jgi:hypothetical protein
MSRFRRTTKETVHRDVMRNFLLFFPACNQKHIFCGREVKALKLFYLKYWQMLVIYTRNSDNQRDFDDIILVRYFNELQ